MGRDELQRRIADWLETSGADAAELSPHRRSASGIPTQPLYSPLDSTDSCSDEEATRYLTRLGLPGRAPFARGITARMYRDQPWIMGQYSGYASSRETNERIRKLLDQGQRGFSIALDLPTQHGLDSDDPRSRGEVGRVGVPIDTLDDMKDLLANIALDQVAQIRTTANAIGPIALAMFVVAAEELGYPASSFRVLLQNDVLKEYLARGTYIFPAEAAAEFTVDAIDYCARHLPQWQPVQFCGYHVRDSGSTAVQEVAIALANGFEYLDRALRRGISIDSVAPHVVMFLSAGQDLFEEVAKFRAARCLWAQLLPSRYGSTSDASRRLNIFAYTLGSPQTAIEPENNIVRIAYQVLAAALGGVQTLATTSYDEALGLPSDRAVKLSLRTQQIAAYETGVTQVADPMGGSYFLEHLTDELDTRIREYLDQILAHGGAVNALESGWLVSELETEALRLQRATDSGDHVVVGVNRFRADQPERHEYRPLAIASATEQEQIDRLTEIRSRRNATAVQHSLDHLRVTASNSGNTVPAIIDAVRSYASVGEITGALADVWGRHNDFRPRPS